MWILFPFLDIEELPSSIQEQLFEELLDRDAQKQLEEVSPIINWSLEITERLGSRLYALWNRTAGLLWPTRCSKRVEIREMQLR